MSSFLSQPGGDASHEHASRATTRHTFYEGAASGRTALIVDDNPTNRFALTALLQRGGMTVVEAVDGAQALETVIRRPDIDIVLMDIMMPIMDGYETMTAIRNRPKCRNLPIIAVTAKEADSERQRCIAAGASDYIPKPINAADLFQAITHWLPAPPSQAGAQPPLVDVQAAPPGSPMDATARSNARVRAPRPPSAERSVRCCKASSGPNLGSQRFHNRTAQEQRDHVRASETPRSLVRLPIDHRTFSRDVFSDVMRLLWVWLREQVAHGLWFVAEECAEQRIDSGEATFVCTLGVAATGGVVRENLRRRGRSDHHDERACG